MAKILFLSRKSHHPHRDSFVVFSATDSVFPANLFTSFYVVGHSQHTTEDYEGEFSGYFTFVSVILIYGQGQNIFMLQDTKWSSIIYCKNPCHDQN